MDTKTDFPKYLTRNQHNNPNEHLQLQPIGLRKINNRNSAKSLNTTESMDSLHNEEK